MYRLEFSDKAKKQLKLLQKSSPNTIKKLRSMLEELEAHPREGTGRVERLKHYPNEEIYSRRLDKKNRLVYQIFEDIVLVQVISVYGHYDD